MRNAFVRELTRLAAADPRVMLVTADLGFGVLTDFARQCPRQFLNAGVAEQNMTAMAVGLALEGRTVFTYSIANFPTLRCLEQIRNDACYHAANVKIVSVGGGFAYGALGISHHATEDLAIMRALPNMTVFAPGDPLEVQVATRLAHATPGVCYLRLGRGGEPVVHQREPSFSVGDAVELRAGTVVALLSTGGTLLLAQQTCERLNARGISTGHLSIPTLKPLPTTTIRRLAETMRLIVTIEEHSIVGGLGGGIAEILAESPSRSAQLLRCGLGDRFSSIVGSQEYLRRQYGLSPDQIVDRVAACLFPPGP